MITITGTGFGDGATVTFGGVAATDVVVVNQTTITCTPPDHADGFVEVVVTNLDGTTGTLADAFVYTTLSIDPEEGPIAGGTTLTITISDGGAGVDWFPSGHTFRVHITNANSTIDFSDPDLYVLLTGGVEGTRISDGEVTCETPEGVCGPTDVIVIDTTKVSPDPNVACYLPGGYVYQLNAPEVTDLIPASGPARGGTHVVLAGTFSPTTCSGGGTTVVTFGDVPLTSLGCTVDTITGITGVHEAGVVDVVVINPDGQTLTLPDAYTYVNAPTVTAIDPDHGPDAGDTAVTITGTDFLDGAGVMLRGRDPDGFTTLADAFDVIVLDATTITATTSPHPAGVCDVVVTNPDGQSNMLEGIERLYVGDWTDAIRETVPSVTDLPSTDNGGLWLTADTGEIWQWVWDPDAHAEVWSLVVNGTVATKDDLPAPGSPPDDVWVTENDGQVWTWDNAKGIDIQGTVPTAADLPVTAHRGENWLTDDTGHVWQWTVPSGLPDASGAWEDGGIKGEWVKAGPFVKGPHAAGTGSGQAVSGYIYEGWWVEIPVLENVPPPPEWRRYGPRPGVGWRPETLLPVPVDGWWMSTAAYGGAVTVVASSRPKDPRRWNQIATFATGSAAMLGGSPGIAGVFHNRLVYAASDYTVGTTYPPIRIYDGSFDRELCRLPPTAALAVPKAILSLLVANGTIYLSTFDSGTSSADWRGRVFTLDLNTAVLTPTGGGAVPDVKPTVALASGGSLTAGAHEWAYTWVTPEGETLPSPLSDVVTATTAQATANLSTLANGPTGTTAKKVYQTPAGSTQLKLMSTITGNTTTTATATAADAALGAVAPTTGLDAFPTGHLPYALAWHNGMLWCGTHRQTTGGTAKIVRLRPDIGTWTEDATFATGYNFAALYSWHGTLYAGTTAAAGTFAQVIKRSSDGTWATAHTGSGGAAQHNNGFLAFCAFGDALYVSYWNQDTTAVAKIVKTTDGTTWTTCYTGAGGTLRPFIVLAVDNNELFAIGGGAHLTVAILRSPDGATWINLTDELPDPEKTALPAVAALVF